MYTYIYGDRVLIYDIARLVFECLIPRNPYHSKIDLASCALVCRDWYSLASPLIYVNIGFCLDSKISNIPTYQVSRSPFAKSIRMLALNFDIQDFSTDSDALHFRGNGTIGNWMINCLSLRHLLANSNCINNLHLDFSLPLPSFDPNHHPTPYIISYNDIEFPHSSYSLCHTIYIYLAKVLDSFTSLKTVTKSFTPVRLILRHPMRFVVQDGHGGVMDMKFRWQLHTKYIFPFLPRLKIESLYLGVDWNMPFNWFQRMNHLINLTISQDYRKRYDYDLREIGILAKRLQVLERITLLNLRLVGT